MYPLHSSLPIEQEYELLCKCGHPVKSHSFIIGGSLLHLHVVSVGQCVHPGCYHFDEIPRTDRRRKKQYRLNPDACQEFRPVDTKDLHSENFIGIS